MQAQGKRLLARYLSAIFALSFSSRRIFFKRWFTSFICLILSIRGVHASRLGSPLEKRGGADS
jgi:hypothetical protein